MSLTVVKLVTDQNLSECLEEDTKHEASIPTDVEGPLTGQFSPEHQYLNGE